MAALLLGNQLSRANGSFMEIEMGSSWEALAQGLPMDAQHPTDLGVVGHHVCSTRSVEM